MLNVLEKASSPLSIDQFNVLEAFPENHLFYGIVLRSEFDLDRVSINKKFLPKKFYTIALQNEGFNIVYLYGSFIKIVNKYDNLITSIQSFSTLPVQSLFDYQKILSLYNLSCEETYRYFAKGIYPVDSVCRENLFKGIDFNDYFKAAKNLPFFLTIVSPVIFYFGNIEDNLNKFKNFLITNTNT